jgi:hypothetical protein
MTPPFRAEHAVRSCSFELALPRDRAFALFTPEGEKAWAEGWDPEYLHPADGRAIPGMVFRTRHGGEETIWTMSRLDARSGTVAYVRCTPGSRVATVEVSCTPRAPGVCVVAVTYAITALTEAGNEWVRAMDEAHYAAFIGEWKAAIEAQLVAP